MTADEFLAIPCDGVRRDLIRGQVVERKEADLAKRSRGEEVAFVRLNVMLRSWADSTEPPYGVVRSGNVCCVLRGDPDAAANTLERAAKVR